MIREAVKTFIEGSGSLRVLARRFKAGKDTIHRWVITHGTNCRSPVEIAYSLGLNRRNRWSGILYLDAKWLRKGLVLLLAVDVGALDIVAWMVAEAETEENYTALVDIVEACGYIVKAVVSDGERAILALTQPKKPLRVRKGTRRYPRPGSKPIDLTRKACLEGIPHQWCVIHAQWEVKRRLAYLGKRRKERLFSLVAKTLFAKRLSTANRYKKKLLGELNIRSLEERRTAAFLLSRWKLLTTHHRVRISRRKIPRDTNGEMSSLTSIQG